jgi:peroxiredoxin
MSLPVPEDDGAADHLPGLAAPHVTLPSTSGGSVTLDAMGPGRTVLYVYPRTAGPDGNVPAVFGVSAQDTAYQREVADRLHLPFPLLSDRDLTLAGALGLPTFEAGGMTLFKRITLVIRDGVVEHVFYPVFPPGEHAREVLAWLRSAARD